MNWIVASGLMFMCSIAMYLCVRQSVLLKIPTQFNNLAMFLIPLPIYLLLVGVSKTYVSVTPYQFLIVVVTAFLFSYLGNVFSLKSIEYAPNPGYSLVLSKSYVVFTSIASVFLFAQSLTVGAFIAIVLVIAASALIMINKKEQHGSHVRSSWLPLAIGAFFCWGMLALASKYLLLIGVNIMSRLVFSMIIVSALVLVEMRWQKVAWRALTAKQIFVLLAIGICAAGFNYFMQSGYNTAPNVGYVSAINAASNAFYAVIVALLFKDHLSWKKFVGVVGVTAGLVLLVLS